MAAVFSIGLDAFPRDDNDRIPISYFLKYLCTTPPPSPIVYRSARQAQWTDERTCSFPPTPSRNQLRYHHPLIFLAFALRSVVPRWTQVCRSAAARWRKSTAGIAPLLVPLATEPQFLASYLTAWRSRRQRGHRQGISHYGKRLSSPRYLLVVVTCGKLLVVRRTSSMPVQHHSHYPCFRRKQRVHDGRLGANDNGSIN